MLARITRQGQRCNRQRRLFGARCCHTIISEYASAKLLSGQMHVYRRVLNDKGKAYLKLFKVCTAKLMASCRMSEAEAVEGIPEFEDEIATLE